MNMLAVATNTQIWPMVFGTILSVILLGIIWWTWTLRLRLGRGVRSLDRGFLPNESLYSLVFDGPQNSGKSSLYQKLVNPAQPFIGLPEAQMTKTHIKMTEEWPVAWRKGVGRREILCLRLIDTPGDHAELVLDALKRIDGPISQQIFNIIIVVVSADDIDDVNSKMPVRYLQSAYKSNVDNLRIKGVIVYVNKMDVIYARKLDPASKSTMEANLRKKNGLIDNLEEIFSKPQVRLVFGSVKTEEGLFSLMGEVFQLSNILGEAEHINQEIDPVVIVNNDSDIMIEELTNLTQPTGQHETRKRR